MKKIFLLLLFIVSFVGFSQTKKHYFSYSSLCNIKLELDGNTAYYTFDNIRFKGFIRNIKDEKNYYDVVSKGKIICKVGITDNEIYILNQNYEYACESAKVILLNTSINGADILNKFLIDVQNNEETIGALNNKGYYLQKFKDYKNSILVLTKVIEIDPNHIVAYINLADSYWLLNKKAEASKFYSEYIRLMKAENKTKKIPSYVLSRI